MSNIIITDKKPQVVDIKNDARSITVANTLIYATSDIRGNLERKCLWAILKHSPWLDKQGLPSHVEIKIKDLYQVIHPGKYAGGYFKKKIKNIVDMFSNYEVQLRVSTTNNKLLKLLDDPSSIYSDSGSRAPFYADKVRLFEYIYIDRDTLVYSIHPMLLTLIGKEELPYTTLSLDVIFAAKKSKFTVRAYEYIQIHLQYKQKDELSGFKNGLSNFLFRYSSIQKKRYREEYPIREFFGVQDAVYTHPSALIRNIAAAFAEVGTIIPNLIFDYEIKYDGIYISGILIKTLTFDDENESDEKDVSLPF